MSGLISQTLIALGLVLLVFDGSLAIKYVSLNDQPCMVRPRFANSNDDELH